MTLVVNFFAGPGSGKSTMAAALFAELKSLGINSELATEYAKDKVWEESFGVFNDQIYIFGKQLHRLRKLLGKVDVAITDSPILMQLHYAQHESETFKRLIREEHARMTNLNVFLRRVKKYEPKGRMQTESEAWDIDGSVMEILKSSGSPFIEVDGSTANVPVLAQIVQEMMAL